MVNLAAVSWSLGQSIARFRLSNAADSACGFDPCRHARVWKMH
jgi:hypothetical protein